MSSSIACYFNLPPGTLNRIKNKDFINYSYAHCQQKSRFSRHQKHSCNLSSVYTLILQGQYFTSCHKNNKKVHKSDNEPSNANINFGDTETSAITVITMMVRDLAFQETILVVWLIFFNVDSASSTRCQHLCFQININFPLKQCFGARARAARSRPFWLKPEPEPKKLRSFGSGSIIK